MRSIFLFGAAGALLSATALAQSLSTAEFVNKVVQSDMLEIQASEFIVPNADADTKPFAEMMIKDHKSTSSELKELVQSHKVPGNLPSSLDAEHQKKLDDLRKLSGRDLDRQYDRMQVVAHQQAVDLFTRYSASGDNSELKAWATKTLPRLKEHLVMAQKLDQGGPSPTVGSAPDHSSIGGPRSGANSFTEGQAKSRIETHGYAPVSGLAKDARGVWRGKAMKDGKSVDVSLDFEGNVFAQ
jgi:putative membrane protein